MFTHPRINLKTKELVLNALTDEPQTCQEIADKIGEINRQTLSLFLNQYLSREVIVIRHTRPFKYKRNPECVNKD
jgi:DNA-binding HxlR family transcriptional regulator